MLLSTEAAMKKIVGRLKEKVSVSTHRGKFINLIIVTPSLICNWLI